MSQDLRESAPVLSRAGFKQILADKMELPSTPGRIVPLEGMRGFAALLVFGVHFNALFGNYAVPHSFLRTASRFIGSLGNTGVDLFFVLSGFLMYGIVLEKAMPFGTYFYRRLKRLYPVFLAVVVIYLALSWAMPQLSRIPKSPAAAGLYILANLAMLPGMLPITPIITVAWSLSYEWFFYLLLPLSVWVLRLRQWTPARRATFVFLVCAIYYALCRAHLGTHPRLVMFGSGICLWECARHLRIASGLPAWGEYVAIVALGASLTVAGAAKIELGASMLAPLAMPGLLGPLLFFSMFLFVLYGLFFDGLLKRFFSLDGIRWVGNMSYSYYLIHGLALHGLQRLTHFLFGVHPRSGAFFLVLAATSLLSTLVAASLLYLGVEKPFLVTGRRSAKQPSKEPGVGGNRDANQAVEPAVTHAA
jgi:peptidoglycan/LPS O-acetylase OafA/YrhL